MSKYTKGSWEVQGTTIYALEHAGWRKGVEQMRNRFYASVQAYRDTPQEEVEANARLMASAPDLLEALEGVAQANKPYGMTNDEKARLYRQVDVAIAKAKGE